MAAEIFQQLYVSNIALSNYSIRNLEETQKYQKKFSLIHEKFLPEEINILNVEIVMSRIQSHVKILFITLAASILFF